MDKSQLFFRVYSGTSAGQLRSGRYHPRRPALCEADPLDQFRKHRSLENREPTALISVTPRPLEALNRALAKYYNFYEDPGTIWVVIIDVPHDGNKHRLHHARKLAQKSPGPDADVFKYEYEYVFEWEIPLEYVQRRLSVKTLFDEGVEDILGLPNCPGLLPSFREVEDTLIDDILERDPYETGCRLGTFARVFGRRAREIATLILHSCLNRGDIEDVLQIVYLSGLESRGALEFGDIKEMEIGIRDKI